PLRATTAQAACAPARRQRRGDGEGAIGTMPILQGTDVSIMFGGLRALDKVNFAVEPGEIFGLIGPNGAGKTTLFRAISGLYPPSGGQIIFKDRPIERLKPHQVCHLGIAYTHQIVRPFPEMSVYD